MKLKTHCTFGPSGPGAPGMPFGPCRPVEPSTPLSPGIPRSPCGTKTSGSVSCHQVHNPTHNIWNKWNSATCFSPTLGPIWPTAPSSPGIPWKKRASYFRWVKLTSYAIKLLMWYFKRRSGLRLSVLLSAAFRSFFHTHLVTWFSWFSRGALISRETLRKEESM